MCLKRFNWRQNTLSILLLIIVLASHSSQHKLPNAPQPASRFSKAVSEDTDGFMPISAPTDYRPPTTNVAPIIQSNESPATESTTTTIAEADRRIDTHENFNREGDDEKEQVRSINVSLQELEDVVWDFLAIASQASDESIIQKRSIDEQRAYITDLLFNENVINTVKKFAEKYIFQAASGSALQNFMPAGGRLFLFKGFKKLMWPLFIGVQVAKTVLLAMFLPSIIGSIGKMVGKGLVNVSGFGHPQETVDDFEFKDNPPLDDSGPSGPTGIGYNYPQPSQIQANHANPDATAPFDTAPAAANMLSLYDIADPKPQFTLANAYSLPQYAQQRKETFQSKKDDFKVFHDIPASSMLLTNYDPFYSPLLSRLDSVFHQLNLNGDNEACREKLVCLMYASPAKYMPYSNLVSAQLSRELNELRKPTSDNVEILRFFKYMRAARDGQDGKNCHNIHKKCSSFTDTEQPAMLTTFNDINKLVQARKIQ